VGKVRVSSTNAVKGRRNRFLASVHSLGQRAATRKRVPGLTDNPIAKAKRGETLRRATFTSRSAGFLGRGVPTIPSRFAEEPGSYGEQRLLGAAAINQGRAAHQRLQVEVDHILTDGASRGDMARDAPANRLATLERPAAALPKSMHRLHPTTSGGKGYDPQRAIADAEKVLRHGYPHVGKPEDARQRGHAMGMALHLEGYRTSKENWPNYGKNVLAGARLNVGKAILRAKHMNLIDEEHSKQLTAQAIDIFT